MDHESHDRAKAKLYAPKYYKDFRCIADKCTHSCCIGWEIDIDRDTMQKYADLTGRCGKQIRDSIDAADTPHFRLRAGDRCPHLNDAGLCRIIIELGEGYLCEICREHPRFYNDTSRGKEVGLGMACEEACRIILNSDDYGQMIEMDEVDGEAEPIDFDTAAHREKVYAILNDASLSYPDRLRKLHSEYGVSPRILRDDVWRDLLASLEYLDDAHRELFAAYTSDLSIQPEWEMPLTRALAYFLFRHSGNARDLSEFRAALGFSLFCERLLASMIMVQGVRDTAEVVRFARILSEEIEYSEENTDAIRFEFSFEMEN